MIGKTVILIGSFLGAMGVALGAFGAHSFKAILEQNQRVPTGPTSAPRSASPRRSCRPRSSGRDRGSASAHEGVRAGPAP